MDESTINFLLILDWNIFERKQTESCLKIIQQPKEIFPMSKNKVRLIGNNSIELFVFID